MALHLFGPALGALHAFVAEDEGFEVMIAFLAGVFVKRHVVSGSVANAKR
jgi:hypothetical protein